MQRCISNKERSEKTSAQLIRAAKEMVENRETREPLNQEAVGKIIGGLLGRGMIMVPCGRFGNVFRFMPSLVITKNYAQKAVNILLDTVKEVSK